MAMRLTRQPRQALPIARSNPLSVGLVAAYYPQGVSAIAQGSPRIISGPAGIGFSSTSNSRWQVSANAKVSLSPAWTILTIMQGVETNNSNGGTALYSERPNGNQIVKLGVGDGNTNTATLVVRDASGNNLVLFRGNADVRTMAAPRVIVGVRRSATMHAIYVNGRLDATSTANASGTFNDTAAHIGGDPQDVNSSLTGTASVPITLLWTRALSDAEIAQISANPWQVLPAQQRASWLNVEPPAGSDATASLAGIAATASAGNIVPSGSAKATLAGNSATSQAGIISAQGGASAATAGAPANGQVGAVSPSGGGSAGIVGAQANSQSGAISSSGGASTTLTGANASAQVGAINATAGGNATATFLGVSVAASIGAIAASSNASVSLTGVPATAFAGLISASAGGNAVALVTGVVSLALAGVVTASSSSRSSIVGVSGSSGTGEALASAGAQVSVTGAIARSASGQITAYGEVSPDGIARIFGISATSAVGQIMAQGSRTRVEVSITEDMLCTVVRNYILSIATDLRVIRTPVNLATMPNGPYVSFTPMTRHQLSTDVTGYEGNTRTVQRSDQMAFQIDCYGKGASDLAETLNILYREQYGVEQFALSGLPVAPLYSNDVMQMPFVNDAGQYEERYMFEIVLQFNPLVSLAQQSANILNVAIINASRV